MGRQCMAKKVFLSLLELGSETIHFLLHAFHLVIKSFSHRVKLRINQGIIGPLDVNFTLERHNDCGWLMQSKQTINKTSMSGRKTMVTIWMEDDNCTGSQRDFKWQPMINLLSSSIGIVSSKTPETQTSESCTHPLSLSGLSFAGRWKSYVDKLIRLNTVELDFTESCGLVSQ